MLLKVQNIDGSNYVTTCRKMGTYMLIFACHKEATLQSFEEVLHIEEFKKRLVNLNTRIKFPEEAVKTTLIKNNFSQSSMALEPNSAGAFVLALKYPMAETSTPLKWEWHLKHTDTVEFFREVLLETLEQGTTLRKIIRNLTKELCAKDNELQQYRREGYELRRTTVRTKTFDLLEFNADNQELLEESSAFGDLNSFFQYSHDSRRRSTPSTPSTTASSSSTGSSSTTASSSSSSNVTHKTTSSSSSSNTSVKPGSSYSPKVARSRKRKAQAINSKRLEEKVKQRLLDPQVKFNSQSSQEDELVDWLVEGAVKVEPEHELKQEPKPEPDLTIKTETEEALQTPKDEDAAEVKTEKTEELEEKATTVPEEENNNESLTESDQELNELRSILAASMAQNRQSAGSSSRYT
ncbi:putative uncharacterized protein DDB_G0274435 isoform X1 [Drosophila kikkawai]|uniref:Uncharacterized protein n=1 Tax=Drosophila kikkawai TaxID=30033 RepID=A0A6P4J452_DROKI|nr:suppressor protein SRP40 [Drosophila kikkawai]